MLRSAERLGPRRIALRGVGGRRHEAAAAPNEMGAPKAPIANDSRRGTGRTGTRPAEAGRAVEAQSSL